MRNRSLVSAALVAGAALAMTSTPASANHTEVCVGQGTATTSPLYYPGGPNAAGGTFSLTTPAATTVCTGQSSSIDANGSFTPGPFAYCGHSTGTGTINGREFTYVSVGSILVVTATPLIHTPSGEDTLVGVANAIPDATTGQSCLPTGEGATRFIVTGAVAFIG